jgi:hypothetical protein
VFEDGCNHNKGRSNIFGKQYFKRLLASSDFRGVVRVGVVRVQVVGVEASWNRELLKQQQEEMSYHPRDEMPSYHPRARDEMPSYHPRDILQLAPTSSTLS